MATPEQQEGFLSRWSQRKQALRQGEPLAEPKRDAGELATPVLKPNQPQVQANTSNLATNTVATDVPAEPIPPAPTLQDAQALTTESDFKPFMRADVLPEVKNAAMKQLFKDPHFNIMDMMDTYVDDYSKPDPLPPEMLRKMAVTQFLGFWDETEEEKAAKAKAELEKSQVAAEKNQPTQLQAESQTREDAEAATSQNVAQSKLLDNNPSQAASAPSLATSHTHDHPDLQLQPDDAARQPSARLGP